MSNPLERLFRQLERENGDDDPFFGSSTSSSGMGGGSPTAVFGGESIPQHHGYHVHHDEQEVTIEVELPGVAANDLHVETSWQPNSSPHSSLCMIQWSGERRPHRPGGTPTTQMKAVDGNGNNTTGSRQSTSSRFSSGIRLGPQVDCDRISANLSRGILWLKAPLKEPHDASREEEPSRRSIPIEEKP
jgi:HSP20 family molecular chaperone IbpA